MHKYIIFILFIIFIIMYISIFIIYEGQRGIVLRFGKVLRDNKNCPIIYNPGLHIKIPLIDNIKSLDTRIQTMENQADRFVTKEKKDLIVDSYIKWRINDFSKYYLATGGGNISKAEIFLKRKFSDRLRSELGKLSVKEIVTDSRNKLMSDVKDALNNGSINVNKLNKILKKNYNHFIKHNINFNSMATLGILVVDVRIKQINLPTEVSEAIYQRMRAEREAVARRYRSQGKEEAEKLRALADYKVTLTLAKANRKASTIKGEADAETTRLYANIFSIDPDFYYFIRSLNAYKNSFSSNNSLIFLTQSDNFFKYIKNSKIN